VQGCGRIVSESEISDAIRNSKAIAWQPGTKSEPSHWSGPAWPPLDHDQREAITSNGAGLYDLWEISPVRFEGEEPHTELIVDALFPGNPWLCGGANKSTFKTRHREELRGVLSALSLIVPSPMKGQTGRTKEGNISEHCLDNTGPRRFLVIEQDMGNADEQAAVLLHLAKRAPLALALHSGSKSIHGWFMAVGQSEDRLCRFMRYAVGLGADRATWTRCQFVRMPDGRRENGNRQTVYFFNPEVIM